MISPPPPSRVKLTAGLAIAMLSALPLLAQDNLWVNGNQLLDFNAPVSSSTTVCALPIGPTSMDYQGAVAQYAQNAQYDETGKLLFFVVDGALYDHAGYLMADNDLRPDCIDCLPHGIQEISIVLMPGTCDRYYIISGRARNYGPTGADPECHWPNNMEKSFLGYSVLDLSLGSQYHAGRKGRIWHEQDLLDLVATQPAYWNNMAPQAYTNCQIEENDQGTAVFHLASGNEVVGSQANYSSRLNNIYHVVHEGATPSAAKTVYIRTAMEYLQASITPYGISTVSSLGNSNEQQMVDATLNMTGGIDAAQGPDGQTRVAATHNHSMATAANQDPTLQIGSILNHPVTGLPYISYSSIETNLSLAPTANVGRIRGVAFSPNGRYLYFAQPFAPYIGYVDVLDPALAVHDLAAELGLPAGSLAAYTKGQVRMNRTPDGTGHVIYFPAATGLGYLKGPDSPSTASWHSTMATTVALNAPPASQTAQQGTWPVTQYLMDKQNYRDQQIPSLLQQACCMANERLPEASHPNSFSGITTAATPWTPQNNGLTAPVLCAPAGGSPAAGHVYFDQDFTVQTGARLFVSNMEWRFGPNARLIIEKGAFVQFDNCVLRGDICGPMKWPGVELYGTPALAQGFNAYPPDQGRLVFRNSTVQDALVGVTVGKKNQFGHVVGAGGILEASNSTFLNCRVGVNFYPYQNHLPNGNPTRNRSRFVNTTFTANSSYIAPLDLAVHAQMWKVDGIEFLGCTFENQRTTEHNSSQLGQGIRSLDAHYKVLTRCGDPGPTPPGQCQNVIPSTFTGLDMGIRAARATTTRNFLVDGAVFENNVCGVYANSVLNFEVHKSNFVVGSSKATALDNIDELHWKWNNDLAHRGIYSYLSYGFLVDDNTLTNNPQATTPQLEGIVTGYSGAHNDVVFRNQASHLAGAYIGEGICADSVNTSYLGLWYLCNTNVDNDNGIFSRRDVSPNHALYSEQTIRLYQGAPSRVADNTFGQVSGQLDITNTNFTAGNTTNPLTYWWALPQVPYWPQYTTAGVSSTNQDNNGNYLTRDPANCASRILPITPVPPDPEEGAMRAYWLNEAQARKAAYGNTRYLYDQLIDGGSTDETVQEIQSTWPNEAWELRAILLEKSPFLSADVLKEMVLKNILPPAMVAEICIANPDATKKDGFLKWLQFEAPLNMPQYLIGNIEASWETKTYRTTLESTMAFEHSEMTQALGLTLASYHADTLQEQVDSIRAAWQVLRTPAARYAEILCYLQQDKFDSAYAVMDRLPVEFKLGEKEISEKDRTKQYIGIVQSYRSDGRSEAELNEGDLNALRNLAADAYDRPAEWAQNILCFGYGECRPPRSGGDGEGTPKAMRIPLAHAEEPTPALNAFPNPAGTWANLDYDLKGQPQGAYLAIRDITGKELARIPVNRAEGQAVWDTRQVNAGTYTVELMNNGSPVGAIKLVVKP